MIEDLVHTDFKAVDKRDHVSALYGWLRGDSAPLPIVCDGDKPYGVVNERAFMKSHVSRDAKIEKYVIGTKTLTRESPIDRVFDVIADSRIAQVPVTAGDGKDLEGYVTAADALKHFEVPDGVEVEAVLTEVPILRAKEAVGEAIHHFRKVNTHVLPVIDDNGRLAGVLRRRDMLAFVTDARPSGRKPGTGDLSDPQDGAVEGYVDHNYETTRPNRPLKQVVDDLARFGFLVVEDADGKPVGVLTPQDAVATLTRR